MTTHAGSCHCGKVAFEVDGDFASAITCNCSRCRRTGAVLAFTTPDHFRLTTPAANVSTYKFNRKIIAHQFCATCGVQTHGEGLGPDGKPSVAVNLRCVPEINLDALKITHYDGAKA